MHTHLSFTCTRALSPLASRAPTVRVRKPFQQLLQGFPSRVSGLLLPCGRRLRGPASGRRTRRARQLSPAPASAPVRASRRQPGRPRPRPGMLPRPWLPFPPPSRAAALRGHLQSPPQTLLAPHFAESLEISTLPRAEASVWRGPRRPPAPRPPARPGKRRTRPHQFIQPRRSPPRHPGSAGGRRDWWKSRSPRPPPPANCLLRPARRPPRLSPRPRTISVPAHNAVTLQPAPSCLRVRPQCAPGGGWRDGFLPASPPLAQGGSHRGSPQFSGAHAHASTRTRARADTRMHTHQRSQPRACTRREEYVCSRALSAWVRGCGGACARLPPRLHPAGKGAAASRCADSCCLSTRTPDLPAGPQLSEEGL